MKGMINKWWYLLFPKKEKEIVVKFKEDWVPQKKLVKDLKVYDDVHIKIDDVVYEGWIVSKTQNRVLLSYDKDKKLHDMQFLIANLENQSIITESNRQLILNKEDI